MADYEVIESADRLDDALAEGFDADVYAIDTEFHRERSYYPRVALVQLAWRDRVFVIDPLVVPLDPLRKLLEGSGTAVIHAAGQDLEVLERACGTIPTHVFDTQIAAGFVGMKSPSLASLHERVLDVALPKHDRLTDWLHRPLARAQLDYAASDVMHLVALYEVLTRQLTERGRLEWALDECEQARLRNRAPREPDQAWLRIKETRHLRGAARGVAQAVSAWRERRAQETDQPPRFVLPDLAVVAIAQRPPKTTQDLRRVRGLDDRHLKGDTAETLLEVVQEGLRTQAISRPIPRQRDNDRDLRPAVALVSAWVAQFASDNELDPALVGTRADIESLLRGDDDSRLGTGWRADLVGDSIRRLVAGRAALAFEGNRLVLEDRIGSP